jgi:hypothetical protein
LHQSQLSLITDLLAHLIDQWSFPPFLDWKAASHLALSIFFPSVLWFQLFKFIGSRADIAAQFGLEITLKFFSGNAYRECCNI